MFEEAELKIKEVFAEKMNDARKKLREEKLKNKRNQTQNSQTEDDQID